MHISSVPRHTPTPYRAATQAASEQPAGDSWTKTAVEDLGIVGRNVLTVGGFSAAGAVANYFGPTGSLVAAAGSGLVGAYMGAKSDIPGTLVERAIAGASMAATGSLIGSVAATGGAPVGAAVVGGMAGCGAFRGLIEVAVKHNLA